MFQHTPVGQSDEFLIAHDGTTVFLELAALKRLARIVTNHVISWTILYLEVFLVNTILDKIITNVNMASSFA